MNNFKLDDHKIKPGFKTPDNYFETFPQKLGHKLEEKPVISLFGNRMRIIYAVAAILLIALLVPLFTSDRTEGLDDATLETYLAYHSDISQFDMLTLLEQEDISTLEVEFPIGDDAIEDALTTNSNFEQLLIEL